MVTGRKKASQSTSEPFAPFGSRNIALFSACERVVGCFNVRIFTLKIGNIIGVACVLLAAVAVYYLFTLKSPQELALDTLRDAQWAAEGADVDIRLDACRLDISIRQVQPNGTGLRRSRLVTDLSDFRKDTVNILPINDGRAILSLIPKPISDQQLVLAQRLLSKIPPSMQDKTGHTLTMFHNDGRVTQNNPLPPGQAGHWPKTDLRRLLEQPNGKLTFQLRASLPDTEPGQATVDIQPHEDAPALFDFVTAVEADSTLVGYSFNLIYNAETAARDTLTLGSLEFPTLVRFAVASEDRARETAKALLKHSQANCR